MMPPHVLHDLHDVRRAAALRADLHHDLVLRRSLDHEPAFAEIVRAGFLHIDMLARVRRVDRTRRVPMIRRGHDHRLHRLVIEHFAHVLRDLCGVCPLDSWIVFAAAAARFESASHTQEKMTSVRWHIVFT